LRAPSPALRSRVRSRTIHSALPLPSTLFKRQAGSVVSCHREPFTSRSTVTSNEPIIYVWKGLSLDKSSYWYCCWRRWRRKGSVATVAPLYPAKYVEKVAFPYRYCDEPLPYGSTAYLYIMAIASMTMRSWRTSRICRCYCYESLNVVGGQQAQ
jgi:hypothetical protein